MNSKDQKVLLDTVSAVTEHGSIASAAKALKLPRKTISDRYHKAIDSGLVSKDPEIQVNRVKSEKNKLDNRNKELQKMLKEKDDQLDSILKISNGVRKIKFFDKINISKESKKSESTAIMVLSDIHLEENVDPTTIESLNKYNVEIAEQRVKKFFENGLKLVEMCRSTTKIDNLVLAILGDVIAGYIHEELLESNELSPTEATIKGYEFLISGIEFLVERGNFKQIVIPTCYGNHGRTTNKPRVATAAKNSYEWLLYKFLEKKYHNHPIVKMKVEEGYFNYIDVYNFTIRFSHGDYIKWQGGLAGLTAPLNRAIPQWNKLKPAYLDIMGHWHNRQIGSNYIINGSIVGYGPYSVKIKADFQKPQQHFCLIHNSRGKTVDAPIWVD